MSLINSMRRQFAVWWERLTPDESGSFSFAGPLEVRCRWEDVVKEFRDEKGEMHFSKSVVYVDRPMTVGDRLMLGTLESSTEQNPFDETASDEIKQFEKLPNLRNTETLYTAYL